MIASIDEISSCVEKAVYFVRAKQVVGCLIAARDIPSGKMIQREDVGLKMVTVDRIPQGVLMRRTCVLKRKAIYNIEKGMWLSYHDFGL